MNFTIFTPVYNRALFLNRIYESLLKQKYKDFEWLIVDDGSSDNIDDVVSNFKKEGKVEINYLKKENGGKHTAHNLAIKVAKGTWFMCLDSDDFLVDNALELINSYLSNVRLNDCGIVAEKKTEKGVRLSSIIDYQETHLGLYGYSQKCGASGEYSLIFKTEVLRRYPFPEIKNEKFVTESVLYDRLELDGYSLLSINEVLQVCEYQENGLSNNAYNLLINNPTSYQIYHLQRIDLVYSLKEKMRHAIQYQSFRMMSKNNSYLYCGKYKLFVSSLFLTGIIGALYYNIKKCFNSK